MEQKWIKRSNDLPLMTNGFIELDDPRSLGFNDLNEEICIELLAPIENTLTQKKNVVILDANEIQVKLLINYLL